ncbi:MAG TPA: DUF552 domain-containing protein [Candidatus Aenigmarchaeota archaeon]|nr:DUF552 domain-containing protein [Candidatus Aenigmarchaeota archaeon]
MVLGILKKKPEVEEEEEFLEIQPESIGGEKKILIRVDNVRDYADLPRVQKYLREGYIVFLKIREVRNRDLTELKRIVEKLRKTVEAMNGDIVGVDEDFLILTPSFAKVQREAEGEEKIEVI